MQELTTQTRHLTDEQGNPLTFHYTLLEETTQDGQTHYGIGIWDSQGDGVSLPRLSVDRAAMERLFALVIRLALSPAHLPDVAEDWLGQ